MGGGTWGRGFSYVLTKVSFYIEDRPIGYLVIGAHGWGEKCGTGVYYSHPWLKCISQEHEIHVHTIAYSVNTHIHTWGGDSRP